MINIENVVTIKDKLNRSLPIVLFGFIMFSVFIDTIVNVAFYTRPIFIAIVLSLVYFIFNLKNITIKNIFTLEFLYFGILVNFLISTILNYGMIGNIGYVNIGNIGFALLLWFVLKILLNKINIHDIEKVLIIVGFCGAFISIYFYIRGFGQLNSNNFGAMYGYRLTGAIATDPNYAMFSFIIYHSLFFVLNNNIGRFGWILITICLLLSMSRGAMLAYWCSVIPALFIYRVRKTRIKDFCFIMIIVLTSYLFFYNEIDLFSRFEKRFEIDNISKGAGRFEIWKKTLNNYQNFIIKGIGFGNCGDYNKKTINDRRCFHNTYPAFLRNLFWSSGLH